MKWGIIIHMLMDFKLIELIKKAKISSEFHNLLYRGVANEPISIEEIPITIPSKFWSYCKKKTSREQPLLPTDGVIFKGRVNEGQDIYSVYTKTEWNFMVSVFGRGLAAGKLKRGDRLVNLFNAGDATGDFLLLSEALHRSPIDILHIPMTGLPIEQTMIDQLIQLKVSVLAAPLRTLKDLVAYFLKKRVLTQSLRVGIKLILFGSEFADPKQLLPIRALFPNAAVRPMGYSNPQIGLIGYSDQDCSIHEYRTFSEASWIEIIDPATLEPIHEPGHPGHLLTTQLFRSWMPVIRFPTGEWAEWMDPPRVHERKFRRLGKTLMPMREPEGFALENRPRRHCLSQECFQSNSHFHHGAAQSAEK